LQGGEVREVFLPMLGLKHSGVRRLCGPVFLRGGGWEEGRGHLGNLALFPVAFFRAVSRSILSVAQHQLASLTRGGEGLVFFLFLFTVKELFSCVLV
jgi:hypothetical protein